MPDSQDIQIGGGEVIAWVSPDGRGRMGAHVDDLIPEVTWLWHALEVHCVAGCCSLAAFDLSADRIRWVVGGDVAPPPEPSWRPAEPCDAIALASRIEDAIVEIRELDATTVSSRVLYTTFDKGVFIELLTHVVEALRRA